jgi:hypothetical protein
MYRLYISGDLELGSNKNFMVGSAVDGILTEMDKFENIIIAPYDDFLIKKAREWKAEQEDLGKTVVKESEYENIMAIAVAVQETSIWKDIEKNYTMQDIIIKPDKDLGKHFDCLYGKVDAYKIEGDTCILLDLKTAADIEKRKFFYKAKDFGYFKQLWMYTELLKYKYPKIKRFEYYFVVAEKSEPYHVALFKIPNNFISRCEEDMIETIDKISKDTKLEKKDVTWDDAILLTNDEEINI